MNKKELYYGKNTAIKKVSKETSYTYLTDAEYERYWNDANAAAEYHTVQTWNKYEAGSQYDQGNSFNIGNNLNGGI